MKYYTFCIQMVSGGETVVFSETMTDEKFQSTVEDLKKAFSYSITDWSGVELVSRREADRELEEIVKENESKI